MTGDGKLTRSAFVKKYYGSRPNFQYSYGLKMTPDDIEEGNTILDALIEGEYEDRLAEQQERSGNSGNGGGTLFGRLTPCYKH